MRFTRNGKFTSLFAAMFILVGAASAENKCQSVGGMIMTNLGAVDQSTTLGPVTGDLSGAVAATILSVENNGDQLIFHVQHHWVTDSGDMLFFDPATATTTAVAPGLYAVVNYPVHIHGGTGKFAKATGNLKGIGEADLNSGQLVFRYSGKICLAHGD